MYDGVPVFVVLGILLKEQAHLSLYRYWKWIQ